MKFNNIGIAVTKTLVLRPAGTTDAVIPFLLYPSNN